MKKAVLLVIFSFSVVACVFAQGRKAQVAGEFYPSDPADLRSMLRVFYENAQPAELPENSRVIGIIVPHAGYIYSGHVAAYAYKALKAVDAFKTIPTFIVVGPSHRTGFDGVSAYPSGSWETPLGTVSVDAEVEAALMSADKAIRDFPLAHTGEHSVEVQVPFLQTEFNNFKIAPFVMGYPPDRNARAFSSAVMKSGLYKRLGKDIVIVASSDMSHYHPYAAANMMDGLCLRKIGSMDISGLINGLASGASELCGAGPVIALLEVASKMGAKAKVLKYANSGDVPAGDKAGVVGYGAVVFYITDTIKASTDHSPQSTVQDIGQFAALSKPEIRNAKPETVLSGGTPMLTKEQQQRLLFIARQTLEQYIRSKKVPEFTETDPVLTEKRGGFVTLTEDGQLRGCIGYIQAVLPLYQTVSKMAIEASTSDPRFPEVKPVELPNIHIEISALSPIELIKDVNKIEVGKHGLIIKKGYYQGLLLPQVATEYKWDKWQFLDQTCVKAGLQAGAWKDKDAEIYIFSAQVFGE